MADIEMLQALHGDAFILHCQKGNNKGNLVVDGGPNRNSRNIVRQLDALGVIDLMVLTHYDDDHIGGIFSYIDNIGDLVPPVAVLNHYGLRGDCPWIDNLS